VVHGFVVYVDGEEEVPRKRARKARTKAGHRTEYDSDVEIYDRNSSKKCRKSQLKELFVADDGDEDLYQSRIR